MCMQGSSVTQVDFTKAFLGGGGKYNPYTGLLILDKSTWRKTSSKSYPIKTNKKHTHTVPQPFLYQVAYFQLIAATYEILCLASSNFFL